MFDHTVNAVDGITLHLCFALTQEADVGVRNAAVRTGASGYVLKTDAARNFRTLLRFPGIARRRFNRRAHDNLFKFFPFCVGNRKLRRTTIHTDRNLREYPNRRNVETLHSREMNVHFRIEPALVR